MKADAYPPVILLLIQKANTFFENPVIFMIFPWGTLSVLQQAPIRLFAPKYETAMLQGMWPRPQAS